MLIDHQPTVCRGSSKQLVIAFDVGTTFSGVSFSVLDPGTVPKIRSVTKYPDQASAGSSKIPTVMYYDQSGNMKLAGAETTLPENLLDAEEGKWTKVEWFKLRLRPSTMLPGLANAKLPDLPARKTIVQVFADFLRYLFKCTEKFIKDSDLTMTDDIWTSLCRDAVIVLSHPNGWGGAQQQQMRQAAVIANIVPDTPSGRGRVFFVTEGEASLHYCIRGTFIDKSKEGFVVADLGGGTLDFSAYKVCEPGTVKLEEMDIPKCILEGSIFVTHRATAHLKRQLKGSIYDEPDIIQQISQKFDDSTKITFRAKSSSCIVAFGSLKDMDKEHGIIRGQLKLTGDDMASFFEPSVAAAAKAIHEYVQTCPIKISAVYLVGGFSTSPYLKSEIALRLHSHGISIATPDGQIVKAVAEGAASYYIDHFVAARVARASFGIKCREQLDRKREDHRKRLSSVTVATSGALRVPGAFSTIIKKGNVILEDAEFRRAFFREVDLGDEANFTTAILVYLGPGDPPQWIDEMKDSEKQILCSVTADMSKVRTTDVQTTSISGKMYKKYDFDVVLYLGGPELKAQICWKDQGVEKRSPAEIVFDWSGGDPEGQPSN